MKRKLSLLIVSFLISIVSFSQFRNYKTDSGWNIGFNSGGTWQEKEAIISGSDTSFTQSFTSLRGGFTFGKAIYEEEGSFFAFDLRFRYLRGINYGWSRELETIPASQFNHFLTNDIEAYKNYRMDLNEFSLEGVLTLNSLLEQTGIILYGFGGVGVVDYRVKTDYLNGNYQYNYPDLTYQSDRNAAILLKNNSDLQFESNAPGVLGNQLRIMPSLGLGLGYQFNEVFSMGIEHKLTYAFHNNLDGITSDALNDRYHYTAIKMGFNILNNGSSSQESNEMFQEDYYQSTVINTPPTTINTTPPPTTVYNPPTPPPTNNSPPVTEIVIKTPPIVNIFNPATNYIEVSNQYYNVKAELKHVFQKQNVIFLLNNVQQPNYLFNFNNNIFSANIQLQLGQNAIKIIGQNQDGTAYDEVTLKYVPLVEKTPPTVAITSPIGNPSFSEKVNCLIKAKLTNISSKSQIKFYVNNQFNNSFAYSPQTAVFSSNIVLNNGNNTVYIVATNLDGTASDNKTIIYEKRIVGTPPDVVITSPNTNPFQTKQPTCTIKAIANHVDSKQKIRVVWNTKQITNYSFNTISRELSFSANLNEGNNFLIITAQNDFGSDTEKTTINYQKKVVVNPPDVIFEFPSSSVYNTDKESILVSGKIKHVTSINNAIATFNNKPAKYFNFNPGSSDFQATLTLVPGNNIFTVKGTNSSGSDTEQISIVFTPVECDNPAINLVQPQSNTVSTTNTKAFIKMNVLNTQNIAFKINGNSSSGYNFDVNTGVFSTMLNLSPGTTVYTLTATNDCGTTSQTVTYQLAQQAPMGQAPIIQMNISNNYSSYANPIITNASSLQLSGKISNYDSKTMMSYTSSPINKVKLDYTLSSGVISGTVFLPPNQVIIVSITAENKWGRTTKDIYFQKPQRNPSSNGSNVSNSNNNPIITKPTPAPAPTPTPKPVINNTINDYYKEPTPTSNPTNNDSDDDSDDNSFDDTYEEPFSWPEAPEQKEEWSAPPPPLAPAPIIKDPIIVQPQKKEKEKTSQPSRKAPEKTVKPNPIKTKATTTKGGRR